jgi:hypothetical protein
VRPLGATSQEAKRTLRAWLRQAWDVSGREADRVSGKLFHDVHRFSNGQATIEVTQPAR